MGGPWPKLPSENRAAQSQRQGAARRDGGGAQANFPSPQPIPGSQLVSAGSCVGPDVGGVALSKRR
jgi:hypothetical protein